MPLPPVHRLELVAMRQERTDAVVYVAAAVCGRTLVPGSLVTSAATFVTCLECRELRAPGEVAVGVRLEHPRQLLLETI